MRDAVKYVVRVTRAIRGGGTDVEYLVAVAGCTSFNPGVDTWFRETSVEQSEAAKFTDRGAAEVIAAMVGGTIVRLRPKA